MCSLIPDQPRSPEGGLDLFEALSGYVSCIAPAAKNVFCPLGHVLTPHASTLLAPVAAHTHMQDRGAPPVGYVSQAPDHRVARNALAPAALTPPVLTNNTARQHCMVLLNALTRHLQPQAIQARERAQIRAIKDSIGHVEVFQMDGVGILIIGRPRPLPGHDTPNPANNTYTLKCEEPGNLGIGRRSAT